MASPPSYPTPTSPPLPALISHEINSKLTGSTSASPILVNGSSIHLKEVHDIKCRKFVVRDAVVIKMEEEKVGVFKHELNPGDNEVKDIKLVTDLALEVVGSMLDANVDARVLLDEVEVALDSKAPVSPTVFKPLSTPATGSTISPPRKSAMPAFGFFATNPARTESSRLSSANFPTVASAPPSSSIAVNPPLVSAPSPSAHVKSTSPLPSQRERALSPSFSLNTSRSQESNLASPSSHSPRPRSQPLLDRKLSITSTSMSRADSEMSESASGNSTPRSASASTTTKKSVGRKPKAKKIQSEPQLIGDLPIAEEQALKTFTELIFSTYANKSIGNLAYEEGFTACDCRYDENGETAEQACGDQAQCMNRLMQIECETDECRCRNNCQNQR